MYTVYFLHSGLHNRYYNGVTSNLDSRLKKHNQGSSKSTKPYRPWEIVYTEIFADKNEAYKREYFLKSPTVYLEKKKIIARIENSGGVA